MLKAAGITAGPRQEDGVEDRPLAIEYGESELLTTPRSKATNCGASGSARRQIKANPPIIPSAGFHTRVAAGRFLSRILASRKAASWARCTAACAIDQCLALRCLSARRCAKLFSSSETKQVAYPCGFAVCASTASSQAISRSTESCFSIHHTAG